MSGCYEWMRNFIRKILKERMLYLNQMSAGHQRNLFLMSNDIVGCDSVSFCLAMDALLFYGPFNNISVISSQWKGNNTIVQRYPIYR